MREVSFWMGYRHPLGARWHLWKFGVAKVEQAGNPGMAYEVAHADVAELAGLTATHPGSEVWVRVWNDTVTPVLELADLDFGVWPDDFWRR